MKKTRIAAITAALLLTLTACGIKSIDVKATGAEQVKGTSNLYRFCDGETLIYFSKKSSTSSDEYEWFYPGGCTANPPTTNVPNGDSTDDRDDK